MSSGEYQKSVSNSKRFSFDLKSLDNNMEPTKQRSGLTDRPKNIPSRQTIFSDVSHSSINTVTSAMEKGDFFHKKAEAIQNIAESSPKTRPSSRHSYDGPYPSDVAHSERVSRLFAMETDIPFHQSAEDIQYIVESSPKMRPSSMHSYDGSYPLDVAHSVRIPAMKENRPIEPSVKSLSRPKNIPIEFYDIPYPPELLPKDTRTDTFSNSASKPKGKANKYRGQNRVPPFKEFPLKLSDLPFTREKIAEVLSLEVACGYLPNFMHEGRDHLSLMELGLDQVCVEMQKALQDAKNICILLENAPVDRPENINIARLQAEKLMHLIITSFRTFIKIAESGKTLNKGLQKYAKWRKDFHTSVDNLLEFIFQNVIEKCWSTGMYV